LIFFNTIEYSVNSSFYEKYPQRMIRHNPNSWERLPLFHQVTDVKVSTSLRRGSLQGLPASLEYSAAWHTTLSHWALLDFID